MRFDPTATLYMPASIGNCDGTIDFDSEAPTIFEAEKDAEAYMKEQANGFGLAFVTYKLTPVSRVVKKMKFERIKETGK